MPSTSALSETHLPTIEESTHRNPFEIIDSPWGRIECWRASALATGTMGALAQVYQMVRNDAAELEQKAVELDAKRSAVLSTINRLMKFMSRVDALTARVEQLEAKRRADEAEQREFEEEEISLPPDIAEFQTLAPATKIEDETDHPSGELHAIAPKDEPLSDDNEGDLPNELLEAVPPAPSTYPNPELPKPSVVEQPIAISLNTE